MNYTLSFQYPQDFPQNLTGGVKGVSKVSWIIGFSQLTIHHSSALQKTQFLFAVWALQALLEPLWRPFENFSNLKIDSSKKCIHIWLACSTSGYLPQSVHAGWGDEIILTACVHQGFHILSSTLWGGNVLFSRSQKSKREKRCRG